MLTATMNGKEQPAVKQIRNAMTVDVEDYFQVSAFASHIPKDSWSTLACRVEGNVDRILAMFDANNIRATFFTLGWIAKRYPAMVRRIVGQGHELASHGYAHDRASDLDAKAFSEDVCRSKKLLEDISGYKVQGYRAPSFSIGGANLWTLDTLLNAGYRYSSSIYPIRHDHYGMPDAPRFAFYPNGDGGLLELPSTTVRLLNRNLPAGGGGYFRFFPYAASRWLMRRVNDRDWGNVRFGRSLDWWRARKAPCTLEMSRASMPRRRNGTSRLTMILNRPTAPCANS
jgi:polysaccharide deacetylase family protein (PEP-CTERM system associated)